MYYEWSAAATAATDDDDDDDDDDVESGLRHSAATAAGDSGAAPHAAPQWRLQAREEGGTAACASERPRTRLSAAAPSLTARGEASVWRGEHHTNDHKQTAGRFASYLMQNAARWKRASRPN